MQHEDENTVRLAGRVGCDAEIKRTPKGRPVMKLRLCTRTQFGTEWHSVTYWGLDAEQWAARIPSGTRVAVRGSLRTTSYEKDGSKRYSTEVQAFMLSIVAPDDSEGAWLRAEQEWSEDAYLERVDALSDAADVPL